MNFNETIKRQLVRITRRTLGTLQVNVGKLCNQACNHCHVDAGPKRTENMELRTVERILELLKKEPGIQTVDITGGAPELNPHFRLLVAEVRKMKKEVIDRCNITVLFEKGQEDTAVFLRDQGVQIVASLPCYTKANVDRQRGNGVFKKSIEGLRLLNHLGYGKPGSGLMLNLVYNPGGPDLPGSQQGLETDYKRELSAEFDLHFNHLFTITNMPIKRFLQALEREHKLEEYMQLLLDHFNPEAAMGVMCRELVSVGWDGLIHDCDFNQMLEIPVAGKRTTLWDIDSLSDLSRGAIAFDNHCYGCTAGAGSSCGGALS